MTVEFYLRGGQTISMSGIKSFKSTKNASGGFSFYEIVWEEGHRGRKVHQLDLEQLAAVCVIEA